MLAGSIGGANDYVVSPKRPSFDSGVSLYSNFRYTHSHMIVIPTLMPVVVICIVLVTLISIEVVVICLNIYF